jgi:hypothetical protein
MVAAAREAFGAPPAIRLARWDNTKTNKRYSLAVILLFYR